MSTGGGEIHLQFLGDISLNGLFCDPQHFVPLAESLARAAKELGPCDLRCGNFESPLWAGQGFNLKKNPRVCTTEEAATSILSLGLDVAFLSNNHFYDCLDAGARRTREFLQGHGIATTGTGRTQQEACEPLVHVVDDRRVGILNCLDPATNPHCEDATDEFVSILDEDTVCDRIATLRGSVDLVIVSLHWGKYELLRYPSPRQRLLGRRMIESGADIIVGHHSHCLQGYEYWNDGLILYSMGNFVFGGIKGREQVPWPKHARHNSVAKVKCIPGERPAVEWHHFVQDGSRLESDQTEGRRREQENLIGPLQLTGSRYERVFRRELFWQWVVLAPLRFVRSSGGLIGAIRRLRWTHVSSLKRMLFK